MKIGIPTERASNETRVAMTPTVAEKYIDRGFEILVSAGVGASAGWPDEAYITAGCEVLEEREEIFERADIIVHVRGLAAADLDEIEPYADGQVIVGMLGPHQLDGELEALAEQEITAFALELMPRISRAQSMDVLSSMASLAGYKAVVRAADAVPKIMPMQMTAAGTIRPATVFVLGAGVAGLQAIATAGRLGASVSAYDIRPEVKEEVESLGAEFIELDLEAEDASDEEGHAREQDEAFYAKQREMLTRVVAESDIVITTAAIPGRPSPELITTEMIEGMPHGSVIVDLAAAGGGNCEPTVADEVIDCNGITIFGPTNLPGTIAHHASQLYANNVYNFITHLYEDDEHAIDTEDEIVRSTLLLHEGVIQDADA